MVEENNVNCLRKDKKGRREEAQRTVRESAQPAKQRKGKERDER
jgi:hypothetical protein